MSDLEVAIGQHQRLYVVEVTLQHCLVWHRCHTMCVCVCVQAAGTVLLAAAVHMYELFRPALGLLSPTMVLLSFTIGQCQQEWLFHSAWGSDANAAASQCCVRC